MHLPPLTDVCVSVRPGGTQTLGKIRSSFARRVSNTLSLAVCRMMATPTSTPRCCTSNGIAAASATDRCLMGQKAGLWEGRGKQDRYRDRGAKTKDREANIKDIWINMKDRAVKRQESDLQRRPSSFVCSGNNELVFLQRAVHLHLIVATVTKMTCYTLTSQQGETQRLAG